MKTTKDCYTKDGKFCSFAENFECTAPDESFCSVLEDAKCTNKKGKIPQKEATGTLKRLLDETKKEREFISVFTAYMYHPNTNPDIILACCEKLLSIAKEHFDKDMQDALRMEYEKGRADAIADTLSWLENCWPKYCYNHTIIDAYKEGVVKD